MVEIYQILYEKKNNKEFSDYNGYYCNNGNIYHRSELDNMNNIRNNKKYKNIITNLKNKLFWVRDMIINKIF